MQSVALRVEKLYNSDMDRSFQPTNNFRRRSGILLHPTSLPGPFGIGDLGNEAFKFIDFLADSGQSLWQILPLGPTGYGDSPYASFSTFAGNPMIISLQALKEDGYLEDVDLNSIPVHIVGKVDYGTIIPWKMKLLRIAAENYLSKGEALDKFNIFCKEESSWLNNYSLFISLKEYFDIKAQEEGIEGAMWGNFWDKHIALRKTDAINKWNNKLKFEISVHKVLQFFFFRQWLKLKKYANDKNIQIIGDIPIFVAYDSVDVWSNRELFLLDENGEPLCVAGVPPDYFSETGQLWGNPLYNWDAIEKGNFKWWINRIKGILKLVDIIRIDHFRGFDAFWQVAAGEKTATNGKWVKAPGQKLFNEIRLVLGQLPLIAEDLGFITEGVKKLRDNFNFPGMRILQFAFDYAEGDRGFDSDNTFLPHNHTRNSIVYTGTHDNSTMKGWLEKCSKEEMAYIREYTGYSGNDLVWFFIRMAMSSVSDFSIIPMQDFLELGDDARMNIPSTIGGNWSWRLKKGEIDKQLTARILDMTRIYGRLIKIRNRQYLNI